ncbi:MAG: beta-lactamase family protein [Planctomycetaceae bacterium]|nr:beta-lactamase family protein [Planctomycetaceae bacterium]MCB9952392.1 beta-lactamase family protein [Planctomycetaceae bacterium]
MLTIGAPQAAGLNDSRWIKVLELGESLVAQGEFPELSFQVQRAGQATEVHTFLREESSGGVKKLESPRRYLVASLTKPIVAMGVLLLVEDGLLSLNDRVSDWIPEFSEASKRNITIRNLLTHTSGLPDMLPNNAELRKLHSPIATFVEGACHALLEHLPSRGVQYQSMGYALLTPIIERASGVGIKEFFRTRIFDPLEMDRTCLGTSEGDNRTDIAEVQTPPEQMGGGEWNWNSEYWHQLGAPWGGLISTTEDLSKFCASVLANGIGPNGRVFSSALVRTATGNRLDDFPEIDPVQRRTRAWGCGWRHNWPDHRSCFSDLLPANAIGHWGATGTLYWLDLDRKISAVLLTTQPVERSKSKLTHLSNAIVAAFED